jgi:hypothetical protein
MTSLSSFFFPEKLSWGIWLSQKAATNWALVAHACNPDYLRGWDWENHSLRPMGASSFWDPISTNSWAQWFTSVIPRYSRGWEGEDQGSRPVRPQLSRKKLDVVACTSYPIYDWKYKDRGSGCPGQKGRPISKIIKAKRSGGDVAQAAGTNPLVQIPVPPHTQKKAWNVQLT